MLSHTAGAHAPQTKKILTIIIVFFLALVPSFAMCTCTVDSSFFCQVWLVVKKAVTQEKGRY